MQRRHFIKLSLTTTAAVLYSRLTYGVSSSARLMNNPDEVWAQTRTDWVRLSRSAGDTYSYKDIVVSLKAKGDSVGVYINSPTMALAGVRLKWQHNTASSAKLLGDAWERSYGDLQWKNLAPGIKNPWYVILYDNRQTSCFGVKTGCNSLCWWGVNDKSIELTLNTTTGGVGVQLGDRQLHAADIITTDGKDGENTYATTHRFCTMMCPKPRLTKQPVYGINDWYFAYGDNSAELIRKTTGIMAELVTDTNNRPFSVIDAGWAEYSPFQPGSGGWNEDFSKPNDKFKDMHLLGNQIKELGMRPGLWMRPLCARHDEKLSLRAPNVGGRGDDKSPVLDPTIPENLERIRSYFDIYRQWGYEMVKHDFTTDDITGRWGFAMHEDFTVPGWSFYDKTKTNAEIINQLYHTIRKGAGNDIYVIGCNTMSHLSAGVFELCRIGDDTSGKDWDRTRKMGVNTLGFRLPQHKAFYEVDGDCVGLTKDVPWEMNKQWLQLLAESGAPLFISAQPEALGEAQRAAVKTAFAQAARVQPTGEPLDWMTNMLPQKWKLNNREVDFNWG